MNVGCIQKHKFALENNILHTNFSQQYLQLVFSVTCLIFWDHLEEQKGHQQALNWVSKDCYLMPQFEVWYETHLLLLMMLESATVVAMIAQPVAYSLASLYQSQLHNEIPKVTFNHLKKKKARQSQRDMQKKSLQLHMYVCICIRICIL